jgi:hypothetical protein
LKWISNPEVRSQLEAVAVCAHVMSDTVTPTDLTWMASDLTHAIVKKGCRDSLVIDLSESKVKEPFTQLAAAGSAALPLRAWGGAPAP